MDRPSYLLGFLLMVAGGILLLYSVTGSSGYSSFWGYSRFQSFGWILFFAGLTVGVIGVVVPKEMIKTAWISMGIALLCSVVFLGLSVVYAYVHAWMQGPSHGVGFYLPAIAESISIFWLQMTVVSFVILVLRRKFRHK